ncbi:MAG: prepilin peptidase [Planctomycetota bacterium]|nr:MAG: prepilin peptidase [Planctomycetota bacterium]
MQFDLWTTTCVLMVPGVLWAAWIDYKEHRIPNWLNACIAAVGFAAQGWFHGWQGISVGLLGMLVGFALLIVPWLMHAMGAGDVKLLMAIGVWLGPGLTFVSFCIGALIGGAIALVMILITGRFWHAYINFTLILQKVTNKGTVFSDFGSAKSFGDSSQLLPYGVPLMIGTLIVFFGRNLLPF